MMLKRPMTIFLFLVGFCFVGCGDEQEGELLENGIEKPIPGSKADDFTRTWLPYTPGKASPEPANLYENSGVNDFPLTYSESDKIARFRLGDVDSELSPGVCLATEWTYVPAIFTHSDFPTDTEPTKGGKYTNYGNYTWHVRDLLFSRNVKEVQFRFINFKTEPVYDYVTFYDYETWWGYEGNDPWSGLFKTMSFVPYDAFGQKNMKFGWFSDDGVTDTGWKIDSAYVKCGSTLPGKTGRFVNPNEVMDGFLFEKGDTIFFWTMQHAGKKMFVHLQAPASYINSDFDVYAIVDGGPALPNYKNNDYAGIRGVEDGKMIPEFVKIPASNKDRMVWFAVTSYKGKGHFRFHANNVTHYNESIGVKIDFWPDANELALIAQQLRGLSKGLYGATEGQVFFAKYNIFLDRSCSGHCDIVYPEKDNNEPFPAHCKGGMGGNIFFNKWASESFKKQPRAGSTLTHEVGHCMFGLPDEYHAESNMKDRCGHSIMAGKNSLYNADDFCTDHNHGKDRQHGASPMSGKSMWQLLKENWIVSIIYQMDIFPTVTPDPFGYYDTDFAPHVGLEMFY